MGVWSSSLFSDGNKFVRKVQRHDGAKEEEGVFEVRLEGEINIRLIYDGKRREGGDGGRGEQTDRQTGK